MRPRPSSIRSRVDRLLGLHGGDDPGCEATFQALDAYVEAVLRGDDVSARHYRVLAHLRNCAACCEDAEGLLAAIRELGPRP